MSKARTLADFISDGSEFADGTISVAEVSGAAPLASPTFTGTASGTFSGPLTGNVTGNVTGDLTGDVTGNVTGNLTGNVTGDVAGDIDLSAIAATISDTAVDIFVYDTRKDSDGGAWRKRTQHTSWYNETLNTATRGSRKEFPAVAVIVAESNTVTIYDGDDPDLPMWFVYDNISKMAAGSSSTGITAFNGSIVISRRNPTLEYRGGIIEMSFAADFIRWIRGSAISSWQVSPSLVDRMDNFASDGSGITLVDGRVNDVAMTVLPNAPIDATTGLPVPTIAVATDGGVSIIKDDGTVVTADPSSIMLSTAFPRNENNLVLLGTQGSGVFRARRFDGSLIATYFNTGGNLRTLVNCNSGEGNYLATSNDDQVYIGQSLGISKFNQIRNEFDGNASVAYTTSSYNTGWMNGDIKLATLSDTDATNVTGSELVTNGTFDTDTSGWALSGTGASVAVSSGQAVLTRNGTSATLTQYITTEVGKTYTVSVDFIAATGGANFYLTFDTLAGTPITSTTGTYSVTGTATSTSHYVRIHLYNTTSGTLTFDNVSVRLAEEDRSVNGNGLQVFGTVTKSAVATGADLVAYSGFSTSNYLEQPYNSDLDFGTGDFSITGWFKSGFDNGNYQWLLERQAGQLEVFVFSGTGILRVYVGGNAIETGQSVNTGTWNNVCYARRNGVGYMYLNGELKNTTTMANTVNTNNSSPLRLGARNTGTLYPTTGSLALWRISATAPSPEQIKKIYEDEKVLFQEGAQATLYGSSDAVTALAYDDSTELLHVGTSAGRSVFQDLRRVDNTTTAVGAAISASNGLVADE